MPRQIIRRRAAATDLLEHFVFIGTQNLNSARRFLQSAEATFKLLASQPKMGRTMRFRSSILTGIRVFPIRNFEAYLIFYRPLPRGIEIVRVIHGARDLQTIFGE